MDLGNGHGEGVFALADCFLVLAITRNFTFYRHESAPDIFSFGYREAEFSVSVSAKRYMVSPASK